MRLFISYATRDRYFVTLLAKLLEAHNHQPWYDSRLRAGDVVRKRIDEEIRAAEVLLAVVSKHTLRSRWVTAEIAAFQAVSPDAPVIPLLLGTLANLEKVIPGLEEHSAIDFTQCMHAGFTRLFATFGNDFLSKAELANRRSGRDRRAGADRRTATVSQRIAVGLSVSYSRETGMSFLEARLTPGDLEVLREPFARELAKYRYRDPLSGKAVEPAAVLKKAMGAARKLLVDDRSQPNTTQALRAIARVICEAYTVEIVDRRARSDRRPSR